MTEDEILSKILEASRLRPMVDLGPGVYHKYGTAGFRTAANLLSGPVFRLGLLAGLRSRKLNNQVIGVMVTASHNPPCDNGAKVVDPMGEMLEQDWEAYATLLVNAATDEELVEKYKGLCAQLRIDMTAPGRVVFARDTRPSGHTLVACLAEACEASGIEGIDYKILTTPQLHYITRCLNTLVTPIAYGEPTEAGYYDKLSKAFIGALGHRRIKGPLYVDCANGVGGPKMAELLKHLPEEKTGLKVNLLHHDVLEPEALNFDCGADFVKTRQRPPPSPRPIHDVRYCSLDGDADRLIYYYTDSERGFCMLDGDRISSLVASFICELFDDAGIDKSSINIGVVQTAYANGASTDYLRDRLRLPVTCTPTGVKYLHHAAAKYDVGVYFEANGHGTVLFSTEALDTFRNQPPQSPAQKLALDTLAAVSELINQTVGDAMSDLLLVELVLAYKDWTLKEWSQTYTDLPNRLARVEVRDKDAFHTVDAERKLSHPEGAQNAIDRCVEKYARARAFARASGTENACRVYAEAASRHEAEELCAKVVEVVRKFGN